MARGGADGAEPAERVCGGLLHHPDDRVRGAVERRGGLPGGVLRLVLEVVGRAAALARVAPVVDSKVHVLPFAIGNHTAALLDEVPDGDVGEHLGARAEGFTDVDGRVAVNLGDEQIVADLVIMAVGVRPESSLARATLSFPLSEWARRRRRWARW